ncbi:MAG TPA: histidinol-phosphate transaminase, partial [Wenzhouxiangella sp.]|nr:histidinol-phosphate transaminase [Wenzhouxiangella sp.]
MKPGDLARAEIRALKPYASARAISDSAGILLNANENPWPPTGDGGLHLNRYPDPQPDDLKKRLAEVYGVDQSQLLITRGSDEGIDLLVRVFC